MRSPPAGLLLLAATSAAGLVALILDQRLAAGLCLSLILIGSLLALWLRQRRERGTRARR